MNRDRLLPLKLGRLALSTYALGMFGCTRIADSTGQWVCVSLQDHDSRFVRIVAFLGGLCGLLWVCTDRRPYGMPVEDYERFVRVRNETSASTTKSGAQ